MNEFRLLRADEIEARIKRVYESYIHILLYKDARCDMNVLDETVGCMNWKKDYELINGSIACTISLWDEEKKQWIGKQDVGNESNMDAVKGSYSDAQKRAAFAWGIGRELYTSPKIYFPIGKTTTKNGRCDDNFTVLSIEYKDKKIVSVVIKDEKTGEEVTFPRDYKSEAKEDTAISDAKFRARVIANINKLDKEKVKGIADYFNVGSISEMTSEQLKTYMKMTEEKK